MARRDSIDVGAVGLTGTDEGCEEKEQTVIPPSDWYTSSSEKHRVSDAPEGTVQGVSPRATRKTSGSLKFMKIAPLPVRKTRSDGSGVVGERHSKALRFRRRVATVVSKNGAFSAEVDASHPSYSDDSNGPLSPTMGSRIGRYKVVRLIGQGGEGSIFLVRKDGIDEELILKRRVFESLVEGNEGMREVLATARVSWSPFCVSLTDVFQLNLSHGQLALCLVMEHCKNGDLLERIVEVMDGKEPALQPQQVREMLHDIVRGLDAVHSAGFVHRDVKLENVLLASDGRCKICDFGVACSTVEGVRGFVGSSFYAAPEMERDRSGVFSSAVDVWAVGIVAIELASSCVWKSKYGNDSLGARVAKNGEYAPASVIDDLGEDMRAVCGPTFSAMLRSYPNERPSTYQLLRTPFFEL